MHLNQLYSDLLIDGRADGRGGLSPRSVRLVHSVVRKALSDAVRWDNATENVALRADPPRARPPDALHTWTAPQLRRFLDSLDDHPLRPLFWLLAATGMRRGEALGLRWCDLDLDRRRLAVMQTLVQIPGGVTFSPPKTARSRRLIALDAETARVLREHRSQSSPAIAETDLVFAKPDGSHLLPHGVSKSFRSASRKTGLPDIRLHDLRHTHASIALAAGVHPKVISERLGHSSVSFTLDVYSHAIPALDEQAAEAIATLLRQPGSERHLRVLPEPHEAEELFDPVAA